ncbi:LysE family translocator [Candidatus Pelagibacter sp.]|jgi:homoserine/homoserine lactone efflux protein|uniref:LysE family translocator n=1 Tax=uncultured Candidatus Pelagibacter sp. TaxID=372654 RepID=UPI0023315C72|nr:LysE family translocator [uncultured Candidatus Pelagibacter sp.]MDB3946757.1 LysE family translocator [Candidatus Pelagibacter sp.]MDB4811811.1 LysE family translocator [Candidatus Pelagibacter sp.]MDC0465678.1 LysE family translocator [Candidatus Pelagibacter sp.]MDC0862173.1 LysE family translocator [bacterium]
MYPLNYFLFLQIILFLFITPGTPRIVIISYSMNYGIQKCIWTALGDVTANIIQATLVIFVIGSFFSENSALLNSFKWIGVTYILYLAYDLYNSKPKDINSKNINSKSLFSFFKDGFLVAGTSPKAWMFFPLIFPQFIDFNSNYFVQFIILITTYVVLDFLSLIAYALLAQKLIKWIKANPKTINTISASVLVIIAGIIVVTQQY